MLGAILALASAATFGLNNAAVRRGVLTGSVIQAMAITVPLGVPLFAFVCMLAGGLDKLADFNTSSWLWMAMAGVVHFIIGRYGNYRSTRALGANLSSPIQQLSVPISILLAILYLDEFLTPLRLGGFLLVMSGPAMMLQGKTASSRRTTKSGFMPQYREGIFWGIVSALGYGASPLFIIKGLGPEGGLIDSLAGGLVSYSAATVVIIMIIIYMGGARVISGLDRTAGKWFLVSAVFVFLSQMFRYMSLSVAPVTVVVPIQRLSPVFRIIFSWVLNREHEFFDVRTLSGILLSMLGAILLTLSVDVVSTLLPASWQLFLSRSWP